MTKQVCIYLKIQDDVSEERIRKALALFIDAGWCEEIEGVFFAGEEKEPEPFEPCADCDRIWACLADGECLGTIMPPIADEDRE